MENKKENVKNGAISVFWKNPEEPCPARACYEALLPYVKSAGIIFYSGGDSSSSDIFDNAVPYNDSYGDMGVGDLIILNSDNTKQYYSLNDDCTWGLNGNESPWLMQDQVSKAQKIVLYW